MAVFPLSFCYQGYDMGIDVLIALLFNEFDGKFSIADSVILVIYFSIIYQEPPFAAPLRFRTPFFLSVSSRF